VDKTIFENMEQDLFPLTNEYKLAIKEGEEQIKRGEFIEHDKLMSEMKEFLSKNKSSLQSQTE